MYQLICDLRVTSRQRSVRLSSTLPSAP